MEALISGDNTKDKKNTKKALILVDIQNDFMPTGSLGAAGGDEVVPIANQLQEKFDIVIASKDWHPENHFSFVNLWPVHCVQDSFGSQFVDGLNTQKIQKIIYKGTQVEIDSYSAFFDNAHEHKTELDDYLKTLGITDIYIMGLATDYCVKYSVLDACKLGYEVNVIEDGCRAIGDSQSAFEEMKKAGAKIIHSRELL
ncbi:MAG TPA: isochorismatase family protein [Gammaproteobacteria bacterium]|nr:isochorismatase family protein [Gammaproteobacteria bacterium]